MTTTDKTNYPSTGVSITCTLNSLGNSTTAARQATVIDNSSNLYLDALLLISVTTGPSGLASPFAVYVYVSGSPDGTLFEQDDNTLGASDAAYTLNNPSNMHLAMQLYCPTAGKVYNRICEVAPLFGGVMPYKWCPVVLNNTGASLSSSGNSIEYTPIYFTNA
jgi:hypothetical protein